MQLNTLSVVNELFAVSDIFILIQWLAILICAIVGITNFVDGVESSDEANFPIKKTAVAIFLVLNGVVLYSLFEDFQFWQNALIHNKDDSNWTLIFMVNFSPIIGTARVVAFVGLAGMFFSVAKNRSIGFFFKVFGVLNALAAIASIPFALI